MKKNSFEANVSITCTVIGVLTAVISVVSLIRKQPSTGILIIVSAVLLSMSIALPLIIQRTNNIQTSRTIHMIDENLSMANTLLPSTLKYVLRSKSFGRSLNKISVEKFIAEFTIDNFNTQSQSTVHVKKIMTGHAPSKCRTIDLPFSHSQSKKQDNYTYGVFDDESKTPMMHNLITLKNLECIRITLTEQTPTRRDFSVTLLIDDKKDSPSFYDDNRVHAFIADPSFLFSSWKSTKFLFKTEDSRIRKRVGRLFYVDRNTYTWSQMTAKNFDNKGELCFDIDYRTLGKSYKNHCFVVLLQRE